MYPHFWRTWTTAKSWEKALAWSNWGLITTCPVLLMYPHLPFIRILARSSRNRPTPSNLGFITVWLVWSINPHFPFIRIGANPSEKLPTPLNWGSIIILPDWSMYPTLWSKMRLTDSPEKFKAKSNHKILFDSLQKPTISPCSNSSMKAINSINFGFIRFCWLIWNSTSKSAETPMVAFIFYLMIIAY